MIVYVERKGDILGTYKFEKPIDEQAYETIVGSDKKANRPEFEEVDLTPTGQPYILNYHNRKHIFAYATFAITLFQNGAPLFTVPLAPNVWTNISFREGERFFSNTANAQFLVKCTDEVVP